MTAWEISAQLKATSLVSQQRQTNKYTHTQYIVYVVYSKCYKQTRTIGANVMENPLECAKVASITKRDTTWGSLRVCYLLLTTDYASLSLFFYPPPHHLAPSTNNGPRLVTESETNLTTDWPGAWLQFADPKSLSNDS